MKRVSAITARVAFALAWLALAPGASLAQEGAAAEKQAADEPAAAAEPAPAARSGPRVWWNDDQAVETLSLSEEQREKMDAYLAEYREKSDRESRLTPDAFFDALRGGDWAKARAELKRLSDDAMVPVEARGNLKIEVLALLSDEQLAKLVERYPQLIERPWVRGPRAPGRGPRPGARGGRQPGAR